jgi:AraC family transcriptional activator of pobA
MPPRTSTSTSIPQFALYGETVFTHKPEFVHEECIRERSERNGWLIKPHRHAHLFQILFIFSGGAEVRLDATSSIHKGCRIITMPPGAVHGFRFEPDTDGVVLSVALNMLALDAENQMNSLLEGALAQPQILKLAKNSAQYRELFHYFRLIRQELATPDEDQQLALFALVKMVLISLRRLLLRRLQQHQQHHRQTGSMQLISRFRNLLEQHYKQHWKIAAYADALHVSVSTLNRSCQELLGCPTKKLIQERLHMEAKRRLIYTRETLDQISWDLGFKDAPYFSRVFKQLEGASPRSFRQQADRGQLNTAGAAVHPSRAPGDRRTH